MRTAKDPVRCLDAVAQDAASAVRALWGQLDCSALNAVERRGASVRPGHGERLVVVVATGIADRHGNTGARSTPPTNPSGSLLSSVQSSVECAPARPPSDLSKNRLNNSRASCLSTEVYAF